MFVAESSFEFNRRRERELAIEEANRKPKERKRSAPTKFIAEPSHLANLRRDEDEPEPTPSVKKVRPPSLTSWVPLCVINRSHRRR